MTQDRSLGQAQQHGDAVDQVSLGGVRRSEAVCDDVDALPQSGPPAGAEFSADVLDPVADPQRLLAGEDTEATSRDCTQFRMHPESVTADGRRQAPFEASCGQPASYVALWGPPPQSTLR